MGGIECYILCMYKSRSYAQTLKKINYNASLVLVRGPGKMWGQAVSSPRALVWGPLVNTVDIKSLHICLKARFCEVKKILSYEHEYQSVLILNLPENCQESVRKLLDFSWG